jgi:VanZ family protein
LKHARELFWHYWLPVLVMLTLIALESTDAMSGEHTGGWLQQLLFWIGIHLARHQLNLLNMALRKCGHVIAYGLLCLCWLMLLRGSHWLLHGYPRGLKGSIRMPRLWWRADWAWLSVLFTFLVAAADELHQMSIPSRSGSWWDVLLDTSAAVVVVMLVKAKAARNYRDQQTMAIRR